MNLKEELRDINKEKIIIVDKSSSIDSVKKKLLLNYGLLSRTKITTISQLARDLSGLELKKQNLNLINDESARFIIESIMNGQTVKAEVFKREIITLNTYASIYTVILDFKKASILPHMINPINKKIEEVKEIYRLYEIELQKNKLVDSGDILKLKYSNLGIDFYLYENVILDLLELKFLNQIAENFRVLSLFTPKNIKRPLKQSLSSDMEYEYSVNKIGYLYDDRPSADDFKLVKAYGYNNEVSFVYRDILSRKLSFDQCEIVYIGSDYTEYIQNTASFFNAKTTIQEGLKLDNTKAYFFISQIIWYISKGSLLSDLKPLFISGLIDLGIETDNLVLTNKHVYEMLLSAKTNTGAKELAKRLDFLHNSHSKAYIESDLYKIDLEVYSKASKFLDLLSELEDRNKSTDKWLIVLRDILKDYFVKSDDETNEIKEDLVKIIENYVDGPCSYDKVEEKWLYEIELRLRAGRVKMEKAEAGKIHACSYNNTQFLNRDHVYVIGLDAKHFPDSLGEDAVLYDREKDSISKSLNYSSEKSDSYFKLLQLLSTASKDLTLLYSFYDTDNVREINPSAFMAKLLEKKEPISAGFLIEDKASRFNMMDELVINPDGILSDVKESMEDINLKPINIGTRVFSATEIETLIRCNRAHYYSYIVGLEEERQVVLGYDAWLDFMDKGSLVHSIFEKLIKAIQERPEDIDKIINKCVHDEFENVKRDNPVLLENYFNFFRDQVFLAVNTYMHNYYKLLENGSIVSSKTELVISRSQPMEINIPSGEESLKIKLAGRIDRIDFLNNGTLDIVDYKSGKCFTDFKGKYEVFQDYLYSLAVESFFNKKVNDARYDFPLETGDRKSWSMNLLINPHEIKQGKARAIYDALKRLEEGDISKTSDKKACQYCSHNMICRNPSEAIE